MNTTTFGLIKLETLFELSKIGTCNFFFVYVKNTIMPSALCSAEFVRVSCATYI
jgi:hypothetical protein